MRLILPLNKQKYDMLSDYLDDRLVRRVEEELHLPLWAQVYSRVAVYILVTRV